MTLNLFSIFNININDNHNCINMNININKNINWINININITYVILQVNGR